MAIGSSFCGFFPVNVALIHWFERWRARALSSLSLGLALAHFRPGDRLVARHLRLARDRLRVCASPTSSLGLPLAWIIRRRPEDHGETIDGLPSKIEAATVPRGEKRADP